MFPDACETVPGGFEEAILPIKKSFAFDVVKKFGELAELVDDEDCDCEPSNGEPVLAPDIATQNRST